MGGPTCKLQLETRGLRLVATSHPPSLLPFSLRGAAVSQPCVTVAGRLSGQPSPPVLCRGPLGLVPREEKGGAREGGAPESASKPPKSGRLVHGGVVVVVVFGEPRGHLKLPFLTPYQVLALCY